MTRLPPIRPAIFMPLKTRDGVADAPIEPGLRTLCEPCERGPRWKLCALDRALEALADADAGDLDLVARLEDLDGDGLALDGAVDARRGTRRACRCAPTPTPASRWPSSAFEILRSATGVERELDGVVAVELARLRPATTGHGPASITVTGVTPPVSWSKTCVMPSFLPTMPFWPSLRA